MDHKLLNWLLELSKEFWDDRSQKEKRARIINNYFPEFEKEIRRWMMPDRRDIKEKVKKIVKVLPELNCGKCGFDNCGKFARAVVEERAQNLGTR